MLQELTRILTEFAATKFGKPALSGIEIFGMGDNKTLKPSMKDLQDYLATAELALVR
jgi:hypothetical protein